MIFFYQGAKRLFPLEKWPSKTELRRIVEARYPEGGTFSVREFTRSAKGRPPRQTRREDVVVSPRFLSVQVEPDEPRAPQMPVYQPTPAPLSGDPFAELERVMAMVEKIMAPKIDLMQRDFQAQLNDLRRQVEALDAALEEFLEEELQGSPEQSTEDELLGAVLAHIKGGAAGSGGGGIADSFRPL